MANSKRQLAAGSRQKAILMLSLSISLSLSHSSLSLTLFHSLSLLALCRVQLIEFASNAKATERNNNQQEARLKETVTYAMILSDYCDNLLIGNHVLLGISRLLWKI